MSISKWSEANNDDGNQSVEELVNAFDPFICMQVRELMSRHTDVAQHPDLLDLEVDELAQMVRIKFWHVLCERPILHPKAYIRCIVRSEFIDMVRRQKPLSSLTLDQEGEICRGRVLVTLSEGMSDPADEVEHHADVIRCMDEMVNAVLRLPRRQQLVMLCSLLDRVDDLKPFLEAFSVYKKDIAALQWPREESERRLLKASLSSARRKLSNYMQDAAAYGKCTCRTRWRSRQRG